jgi:hypothetical protein
MRLPPGHGPPANVRLVPEGVVAGSSPAAVTRPLKSSTRFSRKPHMEPDTVSF